MRLVIYGSFSCLGLLGQPAGGPPRGSRRCQWHAVVHDTDVPPEGLPVSEELAETFDPKLEEIRDLLRVDESYPATRPLFSPKVTLAVAGYSTVTDVDADRLRAVIFDAFWVKGLDIDDSRVLGELGFQLVHRESPCGGGMASDWACFDLLMEPMLASPMASVSRGSGTLK